MVDHSDTDSSRQHWLARVYGAVLTVALLAGAAESAAPTAAAAPKTHTVTIENMRFDPAELTVQRGERVVWINKDLFPHTATDAGKAFDSGNIAANASWTYVAGKSGDYAYVCTLHPTMQGRLVVR